jgi:hypothetical protein
VKKFTNAIKQEMKKANVAGTKLGVDFIDTNMLKVFGEEKIEWTDGMLLRMTPLVLQRAAAMRTKRRDRARDDCTGVASEAGGEAPAL